MKTKNSPKKGFICYANFAFSLVEMLLALLVLSIIITAMLPVITKKSQEKVYTRVDMRKQVLYYGDSYCPPVSDAALDKGNASCFGNFTVPDGVSEIYVTLIGSGGGGGGANVSGYAEFTAEGTTNNWIVPHGTTEIEATLISGGAGGGAGGQISDYRTFVTSGTGNAAAGKYIVNAAGTGNWALPNSLKNRPALVTGCGGGGGGGASVGTWNGFPSNGHGGGSGGYVLNKVLNFGSNVTALTYYIGGGGGGGGGHYNPPIVKGAGPGLPSGGGGGGGTHKGNGNGGNGAPFWSYNGLPTDGLSVSSACGAAGRGTVYNVKPRAYINKPIWNYGAKGGTQGGGGGGASHWPHCYTGGGGGGGGATQILAGNAIFFNAPGGGGGAGCSRNGEKIVGHTCFNPTMSGGGGGGGLGGGAGGSGGLIEADWPGRGGAGGAPGSGLAGAAGKITTIFGDNYCNGGNGSSQTAASPAYSGYSGKSGALKIEYLDYGPGGSGGGAGMIVPRQKVKVRPQEILTLNIARGTPGGIAGVITPQGNIQKPANGTTPFGNSSYETFLRRDNTVLLGTPTNFPSNYRVSGGSTTGRVLSTAHSPDIDDYAAGMSGYISNGVGRTAAQILSDSWVKNDGASYKMDNFTWQTKHAATAGNTTNYGVKHTFNRGTVGGRGGYLITPFFTCTPGPGGTSVSPNGVNASGYGCGGGGGYGLGNGGKGSGGYARLSYNTAKLGAGAGGASGYTLKRIKVKTKGREVIPYQIGAGGKGGYVYNNIVGHGKKGGDTSFHTGGKLIKAGGGQGGTSFAVTGTYPNLKIVNGTKGASANTCMVSNATSPLCGGTKPGLDPSGTNGGIGADSTEGPGAQGGVQSTSLEQSKGKSSISIGAGGGGAAVLQYTVNTKIPSFPTGGQGGHGMIIVEWY